MTYPTLRLWLGMLVCANAGFRDSDSKYAWAQDSQPAPKVDSTATASETETPDALKARQSGTGTTERVVPGLGRKLPDPVPQTSIEGITPVKTESGLTYYDLKAGSGESAHPESNVSIRYVLWYPEGTTVDSWKKIGRPVTFGLAKPEIIKGWKEGILGMQEGGIRRLEIPWSLGYGETGKSFIPPRQDLVFEVELVKVFSKDEPLPNDPASQALRANKLIASPTSLGELSPTTTQSGLKIWDIRVGEGEQPKLGSYVNIHQTTWLADGTPVESTHADGLPISFELGKHIKGWVEGIATMKVGGLRRVEIPSALAYGSSGRIPLIPPNATLLCDIELLGFHEIVPRPDLDAPEPKTPATQEGDTP